MQTNMSSNPSIDDFLSSYFIGYTLPDIFIESLESHSHTIGENIDSTAINNSSLYFLVSGQVREIVFLDNQRQTTLHKHSAPFVVGLTSFFGSAINRHLSCSTDCIFVSISLDKLNLCLDQNHDLISLLSQYVTVHDLWLSLLQLNLAHIYRPDFIKSSLLASSKSLGSIYCSSSSDIKSLESQSTTYFFGQKGSNYDYATVIPPSSLMNLDEYLPLRLLCIPTYVYESLLSPIQDSIVTSSVVSPTPKSSKELTDSSTTSPSTYLEPDNRLTKYRHFESLDNGVSSVVCCFRSLAHYFNLPIKPDVLYRVLSERTNEASENISLHICAAIAESLGLQTQLLKLPPDLLYRLEVPAFIQSNTGEIAIALSRDNLSLKLSRPSLGMKDYQVDDLVTFLNEENTFDVLIFRITDFTPQKKFGLSWFLPSIRRHKKALVEVFIASFFVQLFQLMNPLIVQQIIDKVIGQGGAGTLPVLAFLIFTFALFENILTALRTNLFIETTNRIDIALGEQVIDHLLRLPLSYFDKRPVGELSSRLGELEQIRSFLTGTALTVVLDVIFSIIYIVVMLAYSWVLSIVALLLAPVLGLITFSVSPVVRSQLRSKAELNASTQNHLVEVLTGIQTVKAQNFETKARWRWKERYSRYIAKSFTNAVTSTTSNALTQFLNQASSLLVLCVGTFLVINGDLSLGQLIAFRIISGYVMTPLLRLSTVYQNFQQTSISLERLADVIDTPSESSSVDKSNISMPVIDGRVQFVDICFSFKPNTALQLSNVSLDVPPGKFVAIVGQSGSGKSTLTKLLPRLYRPASGRILIDGYDISKVELYSLRNQIGIVPQDSLLFEGSVQDNISLSDPDASIDDIISAAKLACAHDFIMSLPSGYATPVGERGGALSGGQRQRIAIARSILQNPRLLVMDEATSALDYETERSVSLNLMDHFRDQTVFFITHRLSSIIHADLIVLMHDGRVDEVGTHSELMNIRGRYYALFNQQETVASEYV